MPALETPMYIEVRLVTSASGRYAHLGVADTDDSRSALATFGVTPGHTRFSGVPASVTIRVATDDFDWVKDSIMALA